MCRKVMKTLAKMKRKMIMAVRMKPNKNGTAESVKVVKRSTLTMRAKRSASLRTTESSGSTTLSARERRTRARKSTWTGKSLGAKRLSTIRESTP